MYVVKNDTKMNMKPIDVSNIRLSLALPGACVWSIIMKPSPPIVNRKLLANPSMMYWPLTLYGMNATFFGMRQFFTNQKRIWMDFVWCNKNKRVPTGRECPCSSVVEPTLGGSTMTSYMIPWQTENVLNWYKYTQFCCKIAYRRSLENTIKEQTKTRSSPMVYETMTVALSSDLEFPTNRMEYYKKILTFCRR